MSSGKLVIEMPYEGTLAKDLVITTANLLLLTGYVNVRQIGNDLEITGKIPTALGTVVILLKRLMKLKNERMKIRWPNLVRNDKNTLKKSAYVSPKLSQINTYGDLAEEYINLLPKVAGVGRIRFDYGDIAIPQLFKLEFYETTLSYNNPYIYPKSTRTNDEMLAIMLSGLAASYVGYVDILTPKVIGDICAARAYINFLLISIMSGPVKSDPVIPYVFYNHIIAQRIASSNISLGSCLNSVIFTIHRISYTGNVFTETSREELRFSQELLNFIDKLASRKCVNELLGLVRMASGAENVEALNAVTFLYEAVHSAFNPLQALYYLARFLADLKASTGETPIGRRCLEATLGALTGF